MEVNSRDFVFQTDSKIVQSAFENDNYLIELQEENYNENICVVYFSSNNIYYPNTEEVFKKQILEKNFYEMYRTRVKNAHKHIFVRDIFKQWYLKGINSKINSHEKFLGFLKMETENYLIYTIGSSAGGYAAVLYGQLLGANKIFSFNGQFMLFDLLESSSKEINPLIFRLRYNKDIIKLYSLREFITEPGRIFYFNSSKNIWDSEQLNHIADKQINVIRLRTSHHGIPFLKIALQNVICSSNKTLMKYTNKINNPTLFSLRFVGFFRIIKYIVYVCLKKIAK
ncbi:hypothetical protein [Runella sp. SP2]|uniref:hypothetical protein n=1 Tax=Runella sp. SP2 TaxID=2268026 RepID=UPI000F084ED0|nr:hypothetical protein [Runella sp. SP2]AYQ31764.1 hypothetical protein DTQ70_06025 [Runella sp. SP2]